MRNSATTCFQTSREHLKYLGQLNSSPWVLLPSSSSVSDDWGFHHLCLVFNQPIFIEQHSILGPVIRMSGTRLSQIDSLGSWLWGRYLFTRSIFEWVLRISPCGRKGKELDGVDGKDEPWWGLSGGLANHLGSSGEWPFRAVLHCGKKAGSHTSASMLVLSSRGCHFGQGDSCFSFQLL